MVRRQHSKAGDLSGEPGTEIGANDVNPKITAGWSTQLDDELFKPFRVKQSRCGEAVNSRIALLLRQRVQFLEYVRNRPVRLQDEDWNRVGPYCPSSLS